MHPVAYEVKRYPLGIAVFGSVPVTELVALTRSWSEESGMKFLRPDVADALQATLVVVKSDEDAAEWLKELGIRKDHPDWLRSGDTGISSMTIFAVLASRPDAFRGTSFSMSAPHDAADFGRCFRLLERYPDWRAQLSKVADACPSFAPLVPIWPELEALFAAGDLAEVSKRIAEATRLASPVGAR